MVYDVLIAGAGVIGGMLARELSRYQLSVCLLEKENDVACGASKANSGIVHGGYDPEPGTLKAQLNREGVELLFRTAEELHVPFRRNGSMVCAFSPEEELSLRGLYRQGLMNCIGGLSIISGEDARKLEPQLSPDVTMVLHVTNAGIICPYELTIAAVGNAMDNGVHLKTNFAICSISRENGAFTVASGQGDKVRGKYLVNCAGCGSDTVAAMAGDAFFKITPRAGEYMLLDKTEGRRVGHTIFRVPTAAGKGILVSPTVDGNLLVGPTAAAVATPYCKDTTHEGLALVHEQSSQLVPSVDYRQVITSFTGVRASEAQGDFIVRASEHVEGLIHAAAIDSPGLTCCVAIAKHLVGILEEKGLVLYQKTQWSGIRSDVHAFRKMMDKEKDNYIRENPAYGKVVCRCETVSEGEILDAIRRNPPAKDLDGVKRRTRSGMGRCQGGFCGPYIMELLAREQGIPMERVTKCGGKSYMLAERIGE